MHIPFLRKNMLDSCDLSHQLNAEKEDSHLSRSLFLLVLLMIFVNASGIV